MFALDEARQRLYFTEWGSHRVGFVDLKAATVSYLVQSFHTPAGIAIDSGRQLLYVSERDRHQLRVIDLGSGKDSVLTGGIEGYTDGPLASARFESPEGLALGVDGRLYVAEFYGGRVRVIE